MTEVAARFPCSDPGQILKVKISMTTGQLIVTEMQPVEPSLWESRNDERHKLPRNETVLTSFRGLAKLVDDIQTASQRNNSQKRNIAKLIGSRDIVRLRWQGGCSGRKCSLASPRICDAHRTQGLSPTTPSFNKHVLRLFCSSLIQIRITPKLKKKKKSLNLDSRRGVFFCQGGRPTTDHSLESPVPSLAPYSCLQHQSIMDILRKYYLSFGRGSAAASICQIVSANSSFLIQNCKTFPHRSDSLHKSFLAINSQLPLSLLHFPPLFSERNKCYCTEVLLRPFTA